MIKIPFQMQKMGNAIVIIEYHPNCVLDGLNELFWPFWLFSLEGLSLFDLVFVELSSSWSESGGPETVSEVRHHWPIVAMSCEKQHTCKEGNSTCISQVRKLGLEEVGGFWNGWHGEVRIQVHSFLLNTGVSTCCLQNALLAVFPSVIVKTFISSKSKGNSWSLSPSICCKLFGL